jgi:hypothetical protein
MEYSKGYDCLFHAIFPWNLWGFQNEITDDWLGNHQRNSWLEVMGNSSKMLRCSSHGAD